MSASVFTYNLTRPYPYRWYTPLLIVGFIIAAVFFSFVNYVSSGYTLQARYLSDPNGTTWPTADGWLKNWPAAFVGNIKPTCQPSSIPVGTTVMTDNRALPWTITNVTLHSKAENSTAITTLSSLVYQSNFLENCQFRSVAFYLDSYLGGRNAPQISWSTWGVEVEGRMYCEVHNSEAGIVYVNLTARYNLLPPAAFENNGTFNFPGRDYSRYSLWWGESLLSMVWWDFVNAMDYGDYDVVSGVISLENNYEPGISEPRLASRVVYLQPPRAGDQAVSIQTPVASTGSQLKFPGAASLTVGTLRSFSLPAAAEPSGDSTSLRRRASIWNSKDIDSPDIEEEAQALALVFLSTMWADLGQSHQYRNILEDPELLSSFSHNLSWHFRENQTIGPELAPYKPSPANDSRLVINPSIFVMNYLCQVPQRKPWGSLITSVLVADLVFLRTLWAIVTFFASYFAKQKGPLANSCESCSRPFDDEAMQGESKEAAHEASEAESTIAVGDDGQSQHTTPLVQRAASRSDLHVGHTPDGRS